MTEYYKPEDLDRFGEVGKHNPSLFNKFIKTLLREPRP